MKTILITGGSGFLGRNLALQLKKNYNVILGSRNNKQNFIASKITGCPSLPLDVSNIESVRDIIKENVARVSMENNVEYVLGISTDKACPPIRNIYGLSKATMERLFCLLNKKTNTQFASVRYGNVAWSTGSVLPIWKKMHDETGIIQTTGPDMRRFFFSVQDAVDLVTAAIEYKDIIQGQILSRVMKSAKIQDILDTWIKHFGGKWEKIKGRPGERDDEFLVGETELPYCQTLILNNIEHFLISPNTKTDIPFPNIFTSKEADRLTEEEIIKILNSSPDIL